MQATATSFVGSDVHTGALVLLVVALMLALGDALLLTRLLFNRLFSPQLTFADIYAPLNPLRRAHAVASNAADVNVAAAEPNAADADADDASDSKHEKQKHKQSKARSKQFVAGGVKQLQ